MYYTSGDVYSATQQLLPNPRANDRREAITDLQGAKAAAALLFNTYDQNRTGSLSENDLARMLNELYKPLPNFHPNQ